MNAIPVYLPATNLVDHLSRKPLVIVTFLGCVVSVGAYCGFEFYRVTVRLYHRRLARKALLVDLGAAHARGKTVGRHYLIRDLSITHAALLGSWR